MKWTTEKPKPVKGQSYVLKTSSLQKMLNAAGLDTAVHLIYRPLNKSFSVTALLDCHYWLPNAHVSYSRFYISTSAVALEDRETASEFMRLRVLPKLVTWMQDILAQSEDSTSIRHDMLFKAGFENGEVKITQS
jgi:hypothetical protein